MTLVDTSVWIDHLRMGDARLAALLESGGVLTHPFVIGEIAMGRLSQRTTLLAALADLPQAEVAMDAEVLHLIERKALFWAGVGYIDAHLLASVRLTAGVLLWTRDRRLGEVAREWGIASPQA